MRLQKQPHNLRPSFLFSVDRTLSDYCAFPAFRDKPIRSAFSLKQSCIDGRQESRIVQLGRKLSIDLPEVVNAIHYITRTGGGGRMFPKVFPPWQTVYWWFRRFVRLMLFRTTHTIPLKLDREPTWREASPSEARKMVGRKRQLRSAPTEVC
ncbi:transposase [Brucella lupini]|uniref:Transposase n=1 Tax=Brucella lupini TaxID=255457 RepID=A0AB34DGT7_9HYPH|nr:transposase [Brucella lupini]